MVVYSIKISILFFLLLNWGVELEASHHPIDYVPYSNITYGNIICHRSAQRLPDGMTIIFFTHNGTEQCTVCVGLDDLLIGSRIIISESYLLVFFVNRTVVTVIITRNHQIRSSYIQRNIAEIWTRYSGVPTRLLEPWTVHHTYITENSVLGCNNSPFVIKCLP
jgi:hypothetical protein